MGGKDDSARLKGVLDNLLSGLYFLEENVLVLRDSIGMRRG